jgi:alpha-beta hydrolase superfamily lysophospholipase
MPARHRYHHSSKRRKSFTITLESVFMFAWNRRSRCAGNRVHVRPEYAVATLTYDKRGVGKSGGVYAGPEVGTNNVDPQNLALLAGDASAAVKELVSRIFSPRTPVGLIGVSQAGWIIPLAAVRTPEVKFMILWSGPLVTTLKQLRFQFLTDGKVDLLERAILPKPKDTSQSG